MSLFPSDGNRKQLENQARAEGRLPPGQSLTLKWPVLHYGSVPHFDRSRWDFKISGEVATPNKSPDLAEAGDAYQGDNGGGPNPNSNNALAMEMSETPSGNRTSTAKPAVVVSKARSSRHLSNASR